MSILCLNSDILPLLFRELGVNEFKLAMTLVWFFHTYKASMFIVNADNIEILKSNGFSGSQSRLIHLLESLVTKGVLVEHFDGYKFSKSLDLYYQF